MCREVKLSSCNCYDDMIMSRPVCLLVTDTLNQMSMKCVYHLRSNPKPLRRHTSSVTYV